MEAFTHETDTVVFSFAPIDLEEYFETHHNPGALLCEIFGDFKRNPLDRLTRYINGLLGAYETQSEFAKEFGQGSAAIMGMILLATDKGDLSTVLELWFFWNCVKGQTISWLEYKIPDELDLEGGAWIDCSLIMRDGSDIRVSPGDDPIEA
jgi:hypothetical protein